ncbi:GNAT family N-acetyltransferase [Streptomyces sp. ST2-7A]|uniref:GNAT family N-acetyltransferase n=1 Tax=Streptomyces sp. ST2-7A TaxID=2907214 RepID=UPI001F35623B|nr:GNAT family N-acetyltransferase [Streptomyces sp. ST2-7A]MCE7079325.1 GNAT family N-acetyltransferase [Streptomyces sp. ST2-7A]
MSDPSAPATRSARTPSPGTERDRGGPPSAGTPAGLRIRRAGPRDVPAVVALVESAYRGDSSREGWTTEADLLDGQRTDAREVAGLVTAVDGRVLLAEGEDGTPPLGCCHLLRRGAGAVAAAGDGGDAYFGMFAVRPRAQGAGVGGLLLAEAERVAAVEWGARRMEMTVISLRSDLIAWYERRGYRRTGRMIPFPYGDARFGLPRRPDLRFEILVGDLSPLANRAGADSAPDRGGRRGSGDRPAQ